MRWLNYFKKDDHRNRKYYTLTPNGFIKFRIRRLTDWQGEQGEGCIVSNLITKNGWRVGRMNREEPCIDFADSGWRFLQGTESRYYMSDPSNFSVIKINVLCNFDPDVIPYLDSPIGSKFVRSDSVSFSKDDGNEPIFLEKYI